MALSTQQQLLVEQRLSNDKKSTGVAYLLWLFLGGLGGHRFYLGRTGSAVTMLILSILGWATVAFMVGLVLLIPLGIWLLVDAFLIPGMIREDAEAKRARIANEVAVMSGGAG
ncbi:TM2 domain-containing protein [Ruegeria sediminis]|uniref:TM2 domain-containing protein n=1 Tax=Ruegeria sediminis TaxID=2583820 RepID=A0ABY2WVJ6_9RHOB|nr:NINE protein [Ruegeria sediminis]TMV06375.1 TM2 domain-containing protein [Ruegeria sediminis]